MPPLHLPNEDAARLLRLLAAPGTHADLTLAQWDRVVRTGRASRLLAALWLRLVDAGLLDEVPVRVRAHLLSEAAVARYRKQLALRQLRELETLLRPLSIPVVLLKGAAYIAQGLRMADGRTLSDVDLLVPKEHLSVVESRLVQAGWAFAEVDAHDDRYYREWSHELPPLRFPGSPLELDLHHGILPPIARVTVDSAALLATSRPIAGSFFRVLAPEDQVLHACVHLFADSDLADRLRDIADIDALIHAFATGGDFWERLCRRALALGLGRSLWYGLRYGCRYLGTPTPEQASRSLDGVAPSERVTASMDWIVARALPAAPLDRRVPLSVRAARTLALARYFWMRMPVPILLRHALAKGLRELRARTVSTA
jgi:hypothetical protein